MRLSSRAKKLATVLLKTASDSGESKEVQLSLKAVIDLIKKDAQFRVFLLSKRITNDDKTRVLRKALFDSIHPIVIEFMGIMVKDFSLELFQQIEKMYSTLYKQQEGILSVTARLSHSLKSNDIDSLRERLESALNKKTELNVEVDKRLLGGIKLRIENIFLDASIQNKLSRLKEELLQS